MKVDKIETSCQNFIPEYVNNFQTTYEENNVSSPKGSPDQKQFINIKSISLGKKKKGGGGGETMNTIFFYFPVTYSFLLTQWINLSICHNLQAV